MKHFQNRETISAVLMVKNEEHQIERALKSLDWVDEIVIVDGESTDKTRDIARKYTDKIIVHPFSGSFTEDRILGEQAATSDWILQMDADEEVTPHFREKCLQMLSNGSSRYEGFKFHRKNFFLGHSMKWGGWRHQIFLMHRRGKATYGGKVHHVIRVQGQVGLIDAEINHYPFRSLTQFVERHNRYSTYIADDIKDKYGLVSLREIKYHLTLRPLKLFWKSYVKKKGYRDGMHGLIFSILFAFQHFLEWAKYWEKYKDQLPAK